MTTLKLTLIALALALCGCTELPTETKVEEATFLTLHVLDADQTSQFAGTNGRVIEEESAWAMGKRPSKRSVIIYFSACEALHIGATEFMTAHHWPKLAIRTFEALTIMDAAQDVGGNYELGVHFKF